MTLTVQLPAEWVEALSALAGRTGRDLDGTVADLLAEQLQYRTACSLLPPSAPTESALLQQIQQGLLEAIWERYHELQTKCAAEQLTSEEHSELIDLTDRIEDWNVRRLELAQKLAEQRGVSWPEIVAELGLAAPPSR